MESPQDIGNRTFDQESAGIQKVSKGYHYHMCAVGTNWTNNKRACASLRKRTELSTKNCYSGCVRARKGYWRNQGKITDLSQHGYANNRPTNQRTDRQTDRQTDGRMDWLQSGDRNIIWSVIGICAHTHRSNSSLFDIRSEVIKMNSTKILIKKCIIHIVEGMRASVRLVLVVRIERACNL